MTVLLGCLGGEAVAPELICCGAKRDSFPEDMEIMRWRVILEVVLEFHGAVVMR